MGRVREERRRKPKMRGKEAHPTQRHDGLSAGQKPNKPKLGPSGNSDGTLWSRVESNSSPSGRRSWRAPTRGMWVKNTGDFEYAKRMHWMMSICRGNANVLIRGGKVHSMAEMLLLKLGDVVLRKDYDLFKALKMYYGEGLDGDGIDVVVCCFGKLIDAYFAA
ncbi:hypothetical protein VNO80_25196 [Phaseolus coccineus]|uniref:Uncharacterized protein n=1 Tax=Phaseolus coccineus TaxID=3886 RepID=A0AAN9LUU0_PHACN